MKANADTESLFAWGAITNVVRRRRQECRQRRSPIRHAGHLSHLGEAEEIRHDRLAAAVLVRAVSMQAIATASGLGVDERQRQIVKAGEPGKSARRLFPPFGSAVGAPGCEAR